MTRKVGMKRATAVLLSTVFAVVTALSGAMLLFGFAASSEATVYTVDLSKGLQEFDGWGLSLSWWATEIGDWTRTGSTGNAKRDEVMEAIYGDSGLGLNIARYNVGGGDDPTHTHMTSDRNTPGWRGGVKDGDGFTADPDYFYTAADGSTLSWEQTPDWRQLWVLDWIQSHREDTITEFYSNSPPYWLTKSGCTSGNTKSASDEPGAKAENMTNDAAHNQAFAEYLLDVYEYLVGQGFTFENIQPFNESSSDYWYWAENGDQEGCHFSAQQQVEILHLLDLEMQKRGISAAYNFGDETNTKYAASQYQKAYSEKTTDGTSGADVINGADRLTYHIYSYDLPNAQRMYRRAHHNGQEVYMSEICYTVDDGGYDPQALATGFKYTQSILDTVKDGGVDAYVFWQGMEDMVGQMKSGTNYGLIQGVYYTQEEAEAQGVDLAAMGLTHQDYVLSKAYYMSGQYTKYIKKGYRLVDVNDATTLAAVSPDGNTLVVVKQNNEDSAKQIALDLNGFTAHAVEKIVTDQNNNWTHSIVSAGDEIRDTVTKKSVTTYVITGVRTAGESRFIDDSDADDSLRNIADVKKAIAEKGDAEQAYFTFDMGATLNNNFDNGNDYYYGSTYTNQVNYFAVRFQGVGFALPATKKSDAGTLQLYIDDATTPVEISLRQSKRENKAIVYQTKDLAYGWHTVIVGLKSGSGYVNFDGMFVYETADKEIGEQSLYVTEAAGVNGDVHFTFTANGYEGYELYAEYRNENAAQWTRAPQTLTVQEGAGKGKIETGAPAINVHMRLAAVKEEQTLYSSVTPVNMLTQTDNVLYFVNCGTAFDDRVSTGAVLGVMQGSADRAYGEDIVTGKSWGYTNALTGGGKGYNGSYDAMTAMMHRELWNKTDVITYRFALDAGSCKVAVGFYGGGIGWGSRSETVSVQDAAENGAGVTTATQSVTLNEGQYTAAYFDITATQNGNAEVKIDGDMVSVIAITQADAKLPLYASGGSNYNSQSTAKVGSVLIGADVHDEIAKNTRLTVYLSDGTTDTVTAADNGVSFSVQAAHAEEGKTGITAGETTTATFTSAKYPDMQLYAVYTWQQEGAVVLYYNIDCGFTDETKTPPGDASEKGLLQSTTRDMARHEDGGTGTTWGYNPLYPGKVNWANDGSADWSIRGDAGNNLSYTMTGFRANEALTVKVSGHLAKGWGARSVNVVCNGQTAGTVDFPDPGTGDGDTFGSGSFTCQANENGELVVKFTKKSGGDPHISYIKVWSSGDSLPKAATIAADKSVVSRQDTVRLSNLDPDATVYVLDENDALLGSFKPTSVTQDISVADYLPAHSYSLRLVQAVTVNAQEGKGTSCSAELVISAPGVTYNISKNYVRGGDAAVVTFKPHTDFGVTALTLTTPDGVAIDLTQGFYYRARKNGVYTVTLVTGGMSTSQTFTVDTIDTVDFGETFSTLEWTRENVTVTLQPTAASGIQKVFVNDREVQKEGDVYAIEATENGVFNVRIVTNAGYSYEKEIAVNNIDKRPPSLSLQLDFSDASGVSLGFASDAASGGRLFVSYNDGEAEAATEQDALLLTKAGKYQMYWENGLGERTQTYAYYMTYGAQNAVLGAVTVGADGTISVTGGSAKLYRAGNGTAETTMKADKAGKYYLHIQKEGNAEVVVIDIASKATGEIADLSTAPKGSSGNTAGMIVGLIIGIAAIAAAAVVCPLLIVKRRKSA